jgi:germination protein M
MIKKSAMRRICVATLALFILLIIYMFPTKTTITENLSYITHDEMPVFLLDKNDYVARTSIIKENDELDKKIPEIIESLTKGTRKSNYIKEGFNALIPEDTKLIDYSIDDNILTINFTKDFFNIEEGYEEKTLEAIIYSLTELEGIDKIKILVEGEDLEILPNTRKLPEYLDKSFGINKIYDINSLKESSKTTIYYMGKNNDDYYYIPVTKIQNSTSERVEIIIKELQTTPIYNTNLISYLAASANLSNYEFLEKSISLSFNNYLLANLQNDDVLEEVKYAIALSIRDTYGIYETVFDIPNIDKSRVKL